MEKKTLTSLAMITFLMTSTAVIAMNEDDLDKSAELNSGTVTQLKEVQAESQPSSDATAAVVQLNDEEQGSSSSSVTTASTEEPAAEQTSRWLSALNPFNWLPSWSTSTSTPSAALFIEAGAEGGANIPPSAAPAEALEESSTSVAAAIPPEQTEAMASLRASILLLNDEELNKVLQTTASDDPEVLKNAKQILGDASASTASSSVPTKTLSPEGEGFLWWLYNKLSWGTTPAATTDAQMLVEGQK